MRHFAPKSRAVGAKGDALRQRLRKLRFAAEPLESRLLLATDLSFAVIGDYGNNNQPEADVSALVHSWKPSFIVTTGDNNYPVGDASTIDANIGQYYHDFIYPYKGSYGAGSPDGVNHFFATLGNHDYYTNNGQPELDYLSAPAGPGNGRYYDFQQGNVGIFVLDDNPGTPDGYTATSVQAQWLQHELAASTAAYKLVFFHEPAYTSGVSGGNLDMRWPFQQWGATAVLSGHDHVYERLNENGLTYMTVGASGNPLSTFPTIDPGSQVRYDADNGAMLIHATDASIEFKFITRTGFVADDYTIANPAPQPAPTAPTGLAATAMSGNQVNLAWTNTSTTAATIGIERSTDGVNFSVIATVNATATTYTDTGNGLTPNTHYTYRISATNTGGSSPYSNLASATTLGAPPLTYLSDLNWVSATSGWGPVEKDMSNGGQAAGDGTTITLRGVQYAKGIGCHAPSQIVYNLGGLYNSFLADVGIDDEEIGRGTGTVGFQVLADGKSIYASPVLTNTSPITHINVDVTGVQQLTLIVNDGGDGNSYDHADWAGARLLANAPVVTAPLAPANLQAVAASASLINLSWSRGSTDESGFFIERSTGGGAFAQIGSVPAGTLIYADSVGLLPNTAYTYRVRAWNSAGNSPYSNTASATTLVNPPATPLNLGASALSSSQIALTWTAASDATLYKIERSVGGGAFAQIGTAPAGSSAYTDSGLLAGTAYTYRIRANNAGGDSPYSTTASATTLVKAPLAPTNLAANATSPIQIALTWTRGSTDETLFKIERSVGGGAFVQVGTAPAGSTTYTDSGLSAATAYTYQIRASNSGGDSPYSNTASATTLVNPPATPLNLGASAVSSSQIALTWTAASDATLYKIERSTGGGAFAQIGTAPAGSSGYTDSGLSAGAAYTYRIRANNAGGDSPYSTTASATTLVNIPLAPTSLAANATSSSQITLTWTRGSTDETLFKIERSTGGGAFVQVGTAPAGSTTYTDSGLTPATAYTYQIRASNSAGDSPYSNTTSATTVVIAPLAPTSLVATVATSGTQVNLAWVRGSTNETLFKIERSVNGGAFAQIGTAPAGSTSYSDSGLAAATTYAYRVRANNSAGDSPYSNTATAITPTAGLPAPWIDKDIGTVGKAGSAAYAVGVFTVKGAGADIWNKADAFNYVYEPLTGDGQIITRVTSVQNTNVWAKAGVMIRESLATNARFADMLVTPAAGIAFQWRSTTGGSANTTTVGSLKAPYWVKLTRVGNTFTGYRSADGITWTQTGTATITMAANVYIGLAVTAHTTTALCAATMDNVAVGAVGSASPAVLAAQAAAPASQTSSPNVLGSQVAGVLG